MGPSCFLFLQKTNKAKTTSRTLKPCNLITEPAKTVLKPSMSTISPKEIIRIQETNYEPLTTETLSIPKLEYLAQ